MHSRSFPATAAAAIACLTAAESRAATLLNPASDLTGAYEWSINLATWNASGAVAAGTTVTFGAPVVITPGTPDLVEITATVTGTPSPNVFARLKVTGP